MTRRTKAEALLLLITLIWGSTFVVVKGALSDASPLAFIAVRFSLAGALLFALAARGRLDREALGPGLVLGVFLSGGYLCQTTGLLYTTASKSAFITGFSVILVPVILVFRGARLRPAAAVGASLGLAGLYFLVIPSGLEGVNRGDVLTMIGSVSFAFHIVLVGHYARLSFLHLVPVQVLLVGLVALAASQFAGGLALRWSPRLLLALAITSVLATAFAFTVQSWAQQYTPAAHTALIFALEPLFAAIASRLVASEHLGGKVLLGSALILSGMVVSEIWAGAAPSAVEG
jgi:drug/metabolite transporter (DMT)-like permease